MIQRQAYAGCIVLYYCIVLGGHYCLRVDGIFPAVRVDARQRAVGSRSVS